MVGKVFWTLILIAFVLMIGSCLGHRSLTESAFNEWCENNTGLFVYEDISLGDQYLKPMPTNRKDIRRIHNSFKVNQKTIIDEHSLNKDYIYNFQERRDLNKSFIGPIYAIETSLIRRSDNKLIAKAVSGIAEVSLIKLYGSNMKERKSCPTGIDENRNALFYKSHFELLKNFLNEEIKVTGGK